MATTCCCLSLYYGGVPTLLNAAAADHDDNDRELSGELPLPALQVGPAAAATAAAYERAKTQAKRPSSYLAILQAARW